MDIFNQTFYLGMKDCFMSKGNSFGYFIKYKNSNVIIPFAISFDDKYIYTTIIAITSIIEIHLKVLIMTFISCILLGFSLEKKNKLKKI